MTTNPAYSGTSQDILRAIHKLQKRSLALNKKLKRHKSARKFFKKKHDISHNLRTRSKTLLAGAGLAGILLANPLNAPLLEIPQSSQTQVVADKDISKDLKQSLSPVFPHYPTKLNTQRSEEISRIIKDKTGINTSSFLDGNTLNHQIGFVGYEQHLKRFPSDTLLNHDEEQLAGIAPGLGAFGYFATDRSHFTTQDYLREKYYFVAQLHLLPNWDTEYSTLKDWYKFRKMIMLNPLDGSAVVGVIADAGPAKWTFKQFGASPESMKALNLHRGSRKGLVILLFVDDPDNLVPLGPVNYKLNI